jgi:hypothetical protein
MSVVSRVANPSSIKMSKRMRLWSVGLSEMLLPMMLASGGVLAQ